MPTFTAESLREMSCAFFAAVGFAADEAALIGRLLVEANLTGHDTHGVRHLPRYLERIRKGEIVPGAPVTVIQETPTTALLDGHRTLGHVAATQGVRKGIEMARRMRISAVGVRNLDHVGRVGAYPEMAAREGLVNLTFVNAQGWGIQVAPFGGIERRMGTNPVAMGFPNPGGDPILLDFATCAIAANKIRQAAEHGDEIGPGIILDGDGNPSQNPADFLNGSGMLRPLGGDQGHKGFALGVMVDLFCGVLAGSGTAVMHDQPLNNGIFTITIDPRAFIAEAEYDRQVRELAAYLRASKTPPGADPVMMPGEFEERNRQRRRETGIAVDEPVWSNIREALAEMKVAEPQPMG